MLQASLEESLGGLCEALSSPRLTAHIKDVTLPSIPPFNPRREIKMCIYLSIMSHSDRPGVWRTF